MSKKFLKNLILSLFFIINTQNTFAKDSLCQSKYAAIFKKKPAKIGFSQQRVFYLQAEQLIWCTAKGQLKGALDYYKIDKIKLREAEKKVYIYLNQKDGQGRGPKVPMVLEYGNKGQSDTDQTYNFLTSFGELRKPFQFQCSGVFWILNKKGAINTSKQTRKFYLTNNALYWCKDSIVQGYLPFAVIKDVKYKEKKIKIELNQNYRDRGPKKPLYLYYPGNIQLTFIDQFKTALMNTVAKETPKVAFYVPLQKQPNKKPSIGLEAEIQYLRIETGRERYDEVFLESIKQPPVSTASLTRLKNHAVFEVSFDNCKQNKTCAPELITTPVDIDKLPSVFSALDCWLAASHATKSKQFSDFLKIHNSCIAKAAVAYQMNPDYWQLKKKNIISCPSCTNSYKISEKASAKRISIQINIGIPLKNLLYDKGFLQLLSKEEPAFDDKKHHQLAKIYYTWKIAQLTAKIFISRVKSKLPPTLTQNTIDSLEGLIVYMIAHIGIVHPTKNSWIILPKTPIYSLFHGVILNKTEKQKILALMDQELMRSYFNILSSLPTKQKESDVFKYQRQIRRQHFIAALRSFAKGGSFARPSLKASEAADGQMDYLTVMALQNYLTKQIYPNQQKKLPIDGQWISHRGNKVYHVSEQFAFFLNNQSSSKKQITLIGNQNNFNDDAKEAIYDFLVQRKFIPVSKNQTDIVNSLKKFLRVNPKARIRTSTTGKPLAPQFFESLRTKEKIVGAVFEVRSGYLTNFEWGLRPSGAGFKTLEDVHSLIESDGKIKNLPSIESKMTNRNKDNYAIIRKVMNVD